MAEHAKGDGGHGHVQVHGTHHIVPLKHYWAVFALLMVGLVLTVAAARMDLGRLNVLIAVGIAAFKATAIILIFMHAKYGSRLVKLLAIGAYLWLALLFVLTGMDYISRVTPADLSP